MKLMKIFRIYKLTQYRMPTFEMLIYITLTYILLYIKWALFHN